MYKKILLLFLTASMLLLCSCAKEHATAAQVLSALIDAEIGLPAGQIYLSAAPEDDASYLSPDLVAALYGEGELPWQLSLLEDYGLFLSTAQHPCEFAVFRVRARSDTDDVAAMCLSRLDALRIHYKDTQYASYTQNARVVVIGKYVLLLISSDIAHALGAAKRVL
jgi:hypothetical protein